MCQQLRYRLLLWHVHKSKRRVLFLRFSAFENWWKGFTHSVSSTCFGLGILYPCWSLSAIWRAFTSGYGDPTSWIDIEDIDFMESAQLSYKRNLLTRRERSSCVFGHKSSVWTAALNNVLNVLYRSFLLCRKLVWRITITTPAVSTNSLQYITSLHNRVENSKERALQ